VGITLCGLALYNVDVDVDVRTSGQLRKA